MHAVEITPGFIKVSIALILLIALRIMRVRRILRDGGVVPGIDFWGSARAVLMTMGAAELLVTIFQGVPVLRDIFDVDGAVSDDAVYILTYYSFPTMVVFIAESVFTTRVAERRATTEQATPLPATAAEPMPSPAPVPAPTPRARQRVAGRDAIPPAIRAEIARHALGHRA